MSQPMTSDGLPTVLPTLFPESVLLYIHGVADDAMAGRGKGVPFQAKSDMVGTTTVSWSYNDYVYLAGGDINYTGAVLGDCASFKLSAPASTVAINLAGKGACYLSGPGNVLVMPSADNTGTCDLTLAVPLPAVDANQNPNGAWDWTAPPTGNGQVVPNLAGRGKYNLMTMATDLAIFACKYPLLGAKSHSLTLPVLKAKQVLPQWNFVMSLYNSGHAGLAFTWSLITGRCKTF